MEIKQYDLKFPVLGLLKFKGFPSTRIAYIFLIFTERILGKNIPEKSFFYYIHSYRLNSLHKYHTAFCNYGRSFTCVIEKDNLFGTQFHPEKSQKCGLKLLEHFINHVS